jgi:hypothetical protein
MDFDSILPPKPKNKRKKKKSAVPKVKILEHKDDFVRGITDASDEVRELEKFLKYEEELDDTLQEISVEKAIKDDDILWQPFPGPQTEFLQAIETEVLFSGGRASGKSQALLVDPTRFVHNPNFRGLIIRKNMKHFRNLIRHAKRLYSKGIPGTVFKEMDKIFVFPSGATLEFGYCEREDDVEQYIGQEYNWLGIDEITQYPGDWVIELLKPSLRTADASLPILIRASTNPTGPGRGWVRERWNIKFGEEGNANKRQERATTFKLRSGELKKVISTFKWIHSTIEDNPIMMKDDEYLATLSLIKNENLRRQWLDGDWDSADGLAFSEFRKDIHTCKPFPVPRGWKKFRGCDWAYSKSPYGAVMLWFAEDPDGTLYVYREYCTRMELAREFTLNCKELERNDNCNIGYLDVSAWSLKGDGGSSTGDIMMSLGMRMIPSDKSRGKRERDKLAIHQLLMVDPDTGKPGVIIFNTCTNLIEELINIPLDPKNNEDVDSKARDDCYDAFRYGIQNRIFNKRITFFDYEYPTDDRPIIVDSVIGY